MRIIDLRSDTVTQPTPEMRQAMATAIVGDDVYQEDPTVNQLETKVAQLFQKEAALFFPSGTMANLTAVMAWCQRRDSEVIVGDKSHLFLYEQTGASQYGGVSLRTVPNLLNGTMNLHKIEKAIREDDIHEPATQLVCVENTHNACGGRVLPLAFLKSLQTLLASKTPRIPIHMDGARLWNAITAMDVSPAAITQFVDSFTVCLSKGLGCPAGSLLVGSKDFIQRARRIRKSLGGGMRQAGVLAAAGLVGLADFEKGILKEDHRKATMISEYLKTIPQFQPYETIETNIVFVEIIPSSPICDMFSTLFPNVSSFFPSSSSTISDETDAEILVKKMKEKGILISAWAPNLVRMVFHRDISYEDIKLIMGSLGSLGT
jgi:threonine aldolase